jgi:GT2 family glycosyltransferase
MVSGLERVLHWPADEVPPRPRSFTPMNLLIVIVNYRSAGVAIDCLKSLEPEVASFPGTRVVVTDGASGDDSVPRLAEAIRSHGWQDWVELQPLEHNGGFAYGNNAAIRPALASADPPRLVLLLNPDTIVYPGLLQALVGFMDANPEVGIAGSRVENLDGSVRNSAFRFQSILSELNNGIRIGVVSRLLSRRISAMPMPKTASQVDWVSGACMMVRREVFEEVGLLDEGYFMYYEETDFCLRAYRAGWPCWYVPGGRIVHLVGVSSGVTGQKAALRRRPRYWFESRRRYFETHHGRARAVLADLAWASGFAVNRVKQTLLGRPNPDPPYLLWDLVRFNLNPFQRWSRR